VNLSGYVNVTAGEDYTLSFDVSGADRTIIAGIGQSSGDYLNHTDTVNLSADSQTIVMHLTAKHEGTGTDFGGITSRVIFDMGADTGAVNIDNVSLTAGHTGTVNLGSSQPAGPVDTDNDGVNDDEDAFPNDASETVDSDNDGVGDNADVFPNDASESADSDNDGVGDNADYAPNDPNVQEGPKQIVSVVGNPAAVVGQTMNVEIGYDASTGDNTTGLGMAVHFNSSHLTFVESADVLATNLIAGGASATNDTDDLDNDPSTDKLVSFAWAAFGGSTWPGSLPESLATLRFVVEDTVADLESVTIGFSSSSTASGYTFEGESTDIAVVGANWDFDGNGSADALTDGLLLVRYAFGLRGDKLVGDGVVAEDSTLTAQEIEANITDAQEIADIDGDGSVDALSDGLLLLRHLFSITGNDLIKGVVHPNGSRQTAEEITAYMNGFMPAAE